MDEDRDFKNAADRAEIFIESMVKTKGTTGTLGDVHDFPNAAIRDMIVDLMHYAEARNRGKSPQDIFYIDINKEFELAKKQFVAEKERMPLTVDPQLEQVLLALDKRQKDERANLVLRQADEAKKLGDTPQLHDRHKKQFEQQDKKFDEERERYIREHAAAGRIRDALDAHEKTNDLQPDAPKRLK